MAMTHLSKESKSILNLKLQTIFSEYKNVILFIKGNARIINIKANIINFNFNKRFSTFVSCIMSTRCILYYSTINRY